MEISASERCNTPQRAAAATLLMVESDVLVRMALAAFLRRCGIRVLEAGSVEEAIAILETMQHADLVFSAHGMPEGVDGLALAQWVRVNRPGLPVTLAGGLSRKVARLGDMCGQLGKLPRPYDPANIERRVRRLRQSAGPARTST